MSKKRPPLDPPDLREEEESALAALSWAIFTLVLFLVVFLGCYWRLA